MAGRGNGQPADWVEGSGVDKGIILTACPATLGGEGQLEAGVLALRSTSAVSLRFLPSSIYITNNTRHLG